MSAREKLREEKKSRIIEAAARVFARKGFAGTVMADIAMEARIGKGTLYAYFDSKEDLFFAVFEWFVKKTEAVAKVSVSALGGSALKRLVVLNDSLMNSWAEMRDLYTLVLEFWVASASSQMRERFKKAFRQGYRDFRRVVSALITEGIADDEFHADVDDEAVAAALVGAWDAFLLQAWFDEAFDPVTTSKRFLSALVWGLAAPHGENLR